MPPQLNFSSSRKNTGQGLGLHLIVACVILLSSGSHVHAKQKIGYVLEMQGKWAIGGTSENVNMGQSVEAGMLLVNSAPTNGDHVVVANLRGEIIKTIQCKAGVCRECRESGACDKPIQPLPTSSDSTSAISIVFNAVLDLFAGKPDRYSIHRVRGSGFVIPRNGVARLEGSAVDVSDFLEGQEEGSYEFQFIPLSGAGSGKQELQTNPNSLNWSPGGKAVLVIEDVHPGLYEIRISRGGETSSTWVLLCDPASYPTSAASFQSFVHQTASWGASVAPATKQSYQRAYLEYSASHSQGSFR
jgi:hypothetical protein